LKDDTTVNAEVAMDIYTFALHMEKDGEEYYRKLSAKCGNKGLKKILTMLADDEAKHYAIIEKIRNQAGVELTDSTIITRAKNIFEDMKKGAGGDDFDISQVDMYVRALEIEKASIEFYSSKANETSDEKQKAILSKLAEEERKHHFLIGNIIEFVNRPALWLENSEFNHLDEY
jgi:rubrerythrin